MKYRNGYTHLILCIQQNNIKAITKLLEHSGTDLNIEDNSGCTAVMYAIESHHDTDNIKLVQMLISHPSYNINKMHTILHYVSCTDLMYAVINKRDDIVDLMLQIPNCDVSVCNSNGMTAMAYGLQRRSYYLESMLRLVWKIVQHYSYLPNKFHVNGTTGKIQLLICCILS